ncbi:MAG: hypothetical protein ABIC04_04640 [Nanoarchaeota archaeon]
MADYLINIAIKVNESTPVVKDGQFKIAPTQKELSLYDVCQTVQDRETAEYTKRMFRKADGYRLRRQQPMDEQLEKLGVRRAGRYFEIESDSDFNVAASEVKQRIRNLSDVNLDIEITRV